MAESKKTLTFETKEEAEVFKKFMEKQGFTVTEIEEVEIPETPEEEEQLRQKKAEEEESGG